MNDLISRQDLKEAVFDHCVSMSVCESKEERAGMIRMRDAILEDIDNAQAVAYVDKFIGEPVYEEVKI